MFGLMKTGICSRRSSDRDARRLSYCGTCKTLGAAYGQRARLLLDHDAVFLAELMEALQPEDGAPPDRALRSYSCLALPAKGAAVPLRLRYAAAATVFLAEAKVADRREDAPSRWVEAAAKAYGRAFSAAREELAAWGAPVEEIRALLASQGGREAEARAAGAGGDAAALLARLGEPTAEATGLLFGQAARLAGRPEVAAAMEGLGRAFGTLVYLLDAFEDFEKDAARGDFNAFRAAYAFPPGPATAKVRAGIGQAVWSAGVEAAGRIEALPIDPGRRSLFASRLRSNLAARLAGGRRLSHSCGTPAADGQGRLLSAAGRARSIAAASLAGSSGAVRALLTPLLALLAFPIALFLPSWASPERSLPESLGLLSNLMFAGGVLRTLVSPLQFAAAGPRIPPPPIPGAPGGGTHGHHDHKGGEGSGGSCCDGCDCGDCCCSGCDCDC